MEKLVAKLHSLERQVLPVLSKEKELSGIVKSSGLQEIEVMRALQWLENKKAVKIVVDKKKVVLLDKNGLQYKKEGLPEKRLLKVLGDKFSALSLVAKKANLNKEETNACLGLLRSKLAIEIKKENELMVKLGPQGLRLLKETPEEKFLHRDFPLDFNLIKDLDKLALDNLLKRKGFLKIEEVKAVSVELLEVGKKLAKLKLGGDVENRLTPGMLKTGKWKGKNFREYDVEINVPQINGGKIHFVNQAVDYIKKIWLELGFKEMKGNYVESSFWDLDALFVPQDHPARDMQDTFYLNGKAKLPNVYRVVRKVHENGGDTRSKGWGGNYSRAEAERILLRTHTTNLSARTIAGLKKEDLPAKFFSVGKVFRNEALDWKHLFEFYQVEGIVVDPNANLKHLKGYLTEFYQKMGYTKVRMRPAHFPYTEPSVEVDVFHPGKKEWVELGGAGIFRPEVVKPLLGFDCPVLAWGQGMGRIISEYWKIKDIRELYKNDLKQLREMKAWLK